jgi:VanZ family protein
MLVLVYAGAIFAFSSIPGKNLPAIGVSDKLLHAVEFGGLALLLCRAISAVAPTRPPRLVALISVVATLSYGAVDEAHQSFVTQRVADLADALLAASGWWWARARWPWIQ